jgi:predicted transcriptional regulator
MRYSCFPLFARDFERVLTRARESTTLLVMRTTIEISDDLAKRAKRLAATRHTTLRALIEESLRDRLDATDECANSPRRTIRWVTVDGGLPEGLDVANRDELHRWMSENAV